MIAMKREVAAHIEAGFPWSECQVRKLTTSHCTNVNVCEEQKQRGVLRRFKRRKLIQDTHGRVYSHRLSYLK